MTAVRRSLGTLLGAVLLVGCAAPTVPTAAPSPSNEASGSPPPTATPARDPSVPPEPTPAASPTSTPTPGHAAALTVTGRGSCYGMNFGLCWQVLLLEQAPTRTLLDWTPSADDLQFVSDRGYPESVVTGPPPNAPRDIGLGRWAVGLAVAIGSDIVGEPPAAAVLCVREFEVTEKTAQVRIDAEFGPACTIRLALEWNQATPAPPYPTSIPVPVWTPPDGGILDDCNHRRALLRIDSDGRPWYEEVATGNRIESVEYAGWDVRIDVTKRLIAPDGFEIPELEIVGLECVYTAGSAEWFGGPLGGRYEAWQPWEIALGDGAAAAARYSLEVGRGHPGGPPPAAVTLTPSTVARLDRDTLRRLDAEIRQTGGDRWSLVAPGWYLSNKFGSPGQLNDELNSRWSGGGSNIDDEWLVTQGDHGPALGADGWGARRAWRLQTAGPRLVWGPDEALRLWEDCSKLVVPTITPGEFGSGVETGIDVEGGIVTANVDEPDGDGSTLVVVDYRDERCRSHPVMGPIIDHLLTTLDPPISPLPTAPARAELIGRLELDQAAARCPILRDAQGEIWELRLPYDYTFSASGELRIIDAFGDIHAVAGDTLAVNGAPAEDAISSCLAGTPFDVTRIVFVDDATP